MTTEHKNQTSDKWKQRTRRGGLYVAVAAIVTAQTGCGDGGNGQDWEQVTVQEPSKGVVTTLEETENGKFSVVNEEVVETRDGSRVIIRYKAGNTDTLTLNQAQKLVQSSDTIREYYHRPSFGLGSILWWSAMGHMMGRSFSSPVSPAIYRDSRGFGGGAFGRGSTAASELQRTAVSRTVMRPVSGRSGFFGRSGRGFFGG